MKVKKVKPQSVRTWGWTKLLSQALCSKEPLQKDYLTIKIRE